MTSAASPELLGPIATGAVPLTMMVTRICAGFPSPADDFTDDELDLQRLLAPNRPSTFLWRVRGSSQVGTGIHDGDVVVVDRSMRPEEGRVVVACIDGTVSLKLYRRGRLAFANPEMPAFAPDEAADIEIWGVVTWTLHKPRG